MGMAPDPEAKLLREQLDSREWLPLWTYGDALHEEGNDEVETLSPSLLIPVEAAHRNEMMAPTVTE
jgi:hypothetical protein